MRLTDLDAYFIGGWHEKGHRTMPGLEGAQGVMFQCPTCALSCEPGEEDGRRFFRGAHYVICWFRNPTNALPVPPSAEPKPGRWLVSGTSLETLTLEPSVQVIGGCAWHGFVRNGDAS